MGNFHFLMLSAEAEAIVNSRGWMQILRTLFLWCVSVVVRTPLARSQYLQNRRANKMP